MTADRQSVRKKLIRFFTITAATLAALLLLLGALYLVKSALRAERGKTDYAEKSESLEQGFDTGSTETTTDPDYAEMDKDVFFLDDSGFGEKLTEKDADSTGARGVFYNYFESLKNGDAEGHAALLSDSCVKNFEVPVFFTAQMVYDIKVSFMRADSYDGQYVEKYRVSYKIRKNDGTYRADVGSDSAKPMIFETVRIGKKTFINAMVPLRKK